MVAGGSGLRFGAEKQFLELAGRPVAEWSIRAARTVADGVVLVVPDAPSGGVPESATGAADVVVTGGASRADSVRAGLAAVPDDAAVVVIHDAVRPLASAVLFASVVAGVREGGAVGVVPVLAVTDTIKRTDGSTVLATLERDGLVTVQTPQAFDALTLRTAHASGGDATDDAGLLERIGATVRTVPGEARNLKLTGPEDLVVAEALVAAVSP